MHTPEQMEETINLTIDDLPKMRFKSSKSASSQIGEHLKKAIAKKLNQNSAYIRIPSIWILSLFYQQSIVDVLDGIHELRKCHYYCEVQGLDCEIILHQPCRPLHGCGYDTPWHCNENQSTWQPKKHYAM